ncbi:DUF2975 domain-containing protein [Christiangramia portivictoriae]|uniref:DUF2975 domain-containing protein n=1 Tax=Christiangramia portivictoriae TaxID=326069 RepID=UPI0004009599|nr:DUF2975 domain-containing protein [Christiangramia portivictoriae]
MNFSFFNEYDLHSDIELLFPITSSSAAVLQFIYSFFLYSAISLIVWLMLKIVNSFQSNKLFTKYQITGFSLLGKLIIWLSVLDSIGSFLMRIMLKSKLELKLEISTFWLFIAIGAFFIVLSKIFERAYQLKSENELTI